MTSEELRAEVAVEFEALQQVVNELEALRKEQGFFAGWPHSVS